MRPPESRHRAERAKTPRDPDLGSYAPEWRVRPFLHRRPRLLRAPQGIAHASTGLSWSGLQSAGRAAETVDPRRERRRRARHQHTICGTDLHLERPWDRNITISTRLVDTATMPTLLRILKAKQRDSARLITHRFSFVQVLEAYDTFAHAESARPLKVIIEVWIR